MTIVAVPENKISNLVEKNKLFHLQLEKNLEEVEINSFVLNRYVITSNLPELLPDILNSLESIGVRNIADISISSTSLSIILDRPERIKKNSLFEIQYLCFLDNDKALDFNSIKKEPWAKQRVFLTTLFTLVNEKKFLIHHFDLKNTNFNNAILAPFIPNLEASLYFRKVTLPKTFENTELEKKLSLSNKKPLHKRHKKKLVDFTNLIWAIQPLLQSNENKGQLIPKEVWLEFILPFLATEAIGSKKELLNLTRSMPLLSEFKIKERKLLDQLYPFEKKQICKFTPVNPLPAPGKKDNFCYIL